MMATGRRKMETRDIWTITDRDILYEDEAMIAIEKPYGLPSQPTLDPKRDNAYAAVMRHCAQSGGYAALHHRLDALTSGILVLAKSKEANPSLSDQFQNHTIRKMYVALCAMPHSVCPKYRTPGLSMRRLAKQNPTKPDRWQWLGGRRNRPRCKCFRRLGKTGNRRRRAYFASELSSLERDILGFIVANRLRGERIKFAYICLLANYISSKTRSMA